MVKSQHVENAVSLNRVNVEAVDALYAALKALQGSPLTGEPGGSWAAF